MSTMGNQIENEKTAAILERYFVLADIDQIRCVDERHASFPTNGVQVPGAIYGVVDAVKVLQIVSEDEAWQRVTRAGIPLEAHDDNHAGARGCGYAKQVETDPASVGAPEKILASDRLSRVVKAHGKILHYEGKHQATHATLNWREGFTLSPERALAEGRGVFNCDLWALRQYAARLELDADQLTNHITAVYRQTVTALSGITQFHQLRQTPRRQDTNRTGR